MGPEKRAGLTGGGERGARWLALAIDPTKQRVREVAVATGDSMADRGQITVGLVDGPLAFDKAVSEEAARAKGIVSPVAGRADIFVAPDPESGNMLAKQLEHLTDAHGAGAVLGARVPIALTSRADKPWSRMVSCAPALLLARKYGPVPV
jgi:phosphate acetyltransferase/phosphate butyryltransferase